MHRNGTIINHTLYKITLEEFNLLLNNAYEFLGVQPDSRETALLFAQADQDQDGLMTYTEYFQFVEKFICRPKVKIPQRVTKPVQRVEFNSRFRRFLWDELFRIFALYDFNGNRLLSYTECERMFRDLFSSIS
jgi:Ca2+-binding EF-hand superfamily protein